MNITFGNKQTVTINGRSFTGHSISIKNNKIVVDGSEVESIEDKVITVNVVGDVSSLETNSGDVTIHGSAGIVKTTSGDVNVNEHIAGSVKTVSGDVRAKQINGSVSTVSGDISKMKGGE